MRIGSVTLNSSGGFGNPWTAILQVNVPPCKPQANGHVNSSGWHALSLRWGWVCPTPFEDSGSATHALTFPIHIRHHIRIHLETIDQLVELVVQPDHRQELAVFLCVHAEL